MAVVSYLVYSSTLLQNATDILKNATAILLQNARNGYYKNASAFYYKMRRFYYTMQCLLQNASVQWSVQCDICKKMLAKAFFSCANIERFPTLSLL